MTKLKMLLKKQFYNFFGKLETLKVEPFIAIGNDTQVLLKGRVIHPYKQSRPKAKNNWVKNIFATVRRYSNSSVPLAEVAIIFEKKEHLVTTDEEGVFELLIDQTNSNNANESAEFRIIEQNEIQQCLTVSKEIQRFSQTTGVISDIDDTILISHSTALGKKFWLSVSKNAYTRRPFPGVSQFYKKLTANGRFPVFYVSSSDWGLYDLIKDFLDYREIPMGPIMLKDNHINLKNIWKSGGGDHSHKYDKICFILQFYPKMNFFLIGDSGQHDPEIYAEVIKNYPGRIKGVFIRIIKNILPERIEMLKAHHGVKIAFVKDTEEAIGFAKKFNFI